MGEANAAGRQWRWRPPRVSLPRAATLRAGVSAVSLYLISLAVAAGLAALMVMLTGHSPTSTVSALYQGSLQDGASQGQTIDEATPLLIVALGTIICMRAGLFNIGQEGQLTIGALVGAVVGLKMPGPGQVVLAAALIGSALGGALWAGIAALLRFWRKVDVVISTLLLTFVSFQVVTYAVNQTWFLKEGSLNGEITVPESDLLADDRHLARIGEYPDLNFVIGCFIALGLAITLAVVLARTRFGFRLRLLGLNPFAAKRAGVSEARLGGAALLLSGAFAGLAGGVILTGSAFRVQAGFANNIGYEGLLVALVAQNYALVAIPVALFFGGLRSGGGFLASTGVPRYLVNIVQALLVLAAVFPPVYLRLRGGRRRPLEAPEPAPLDERAA